MTINEIWDGHPEMVTITNFLRLIHGVGVCCVLKMAGITVTQLHKEERYFENHRGQQQSPAAV